MITIQLPNTVPYSITSGMAIKISESALPEVIDPASNTFCYCEHECEYVEKVFGDTASDDYWKNDKNTFPYRKLLSTDSVVIKLQKNSVDVATITDDTYGEYINGYAGGSPEQQLYVVFTIDWKKVLVALGPGQYNISTTLTILGNVSTKESQKFQLYPYSDINANKTVRIETIQNGNIVGSEFDFTGLELYQSYRLRGKLTEVTPKLEDDSYQDNTYEVTQIQTKLIPQWLLKTERIPRSISLLLTRDSILANEFLITDYNIINEDIFRRISLYPEGIEKPDIGSTTKPIYEITFTDKIENIIKRNN